MWTFLGLLLMVPMASGDDASTAVNGLRGKNVLLPCTCTNINSGMRFYWQKEDADKTIMAYEGGLKINDSYMGRITLFHNESKTNCSIQLHNITMDDQGKYRCSVVSSEYHYYFVHLHISGDLQDPISNATTRVGTSPHRRRISLIIPIGLTVGLCLFLFRRRETKRQHMGYVSSATLENISVDSGLLSGDV